MFKLPRPCKTMSSKTDVSLLHFYYTGCCPSVYTILRFFLILHPPPLHPFLILFDFPQSISSTFLFSSFSSLLPFFLTTSLPLPCHSTHHPSHVTYYSNFLFCFLSFLYYSFSFHVIFPPCLSPDFLHLPSFFLTGTSLYLSFSSSLYCLPSP